MTLFDPGPSTKKSKKKPVAPASTIAANKLPLWEVTVGYTRYYLRADSEKALRALWQYRYGPRGIDPEEVKVRRMTHAEIVELIELDPKIGRKLLRA